MVGICVHIQSRADDYDGNGMMAMVMIVMMIVLVMVIIVPEALRQVDSVRQYLYQTFQQLRGFHQPDALRGKLNSSQSMYFSAAALKQCTVMQILNRH